MKNKFIDEVKSNKEIKKLVKEHKESKVYNKVRRYLRERKEWTSFNLDKLKLDIGENEKDIIISLNSLEKEGFITTEDRINGILLFKVFKINKEYEDLL
ncbi:hypothetical protein K5V21_19020 [Clostridium sardiniense]|uniref:Uncharacterized protein n=1 Tax=Clostridium sardiniense TaxID=29369 RepID=A0ABS7L373_CLOSR|nr:hypothetical protein [Clostridium sardiniense]MBY0757489.1 hypothetical protein [Clostridium sardiniense]MDQ0461959.1 uncharacterized protein YjaZ [Clostridium sardiniense]